MDNFLKDLLNPPPPTTYYKKVSGGKSDEQVRNGEPHSELVESLISGNFQTVINVLTNKFVNDEAASRQIVLISNRYQHLITNKNIGVLSHDEITTETMKISEALLNLIVQIEQRQDK